MARDNASPLVVVLVEDAANPRPSRRPLSGAPVPSWQAWIVGLHRTKALFSPPSCRPLRRSSYRDDELSPIAPSSFPDGLPSQVSLSIRPVVHSVNCPFDQTDSFPSLSVLGLSLSMLAYYSISVPVNLQPIPSTHLTRHAKTQSKLPTQGLPGIVQ